VMDVASVALREGVAESVTRNVKLLVPLPEGVPEIIPVVAFSVRPVGRAPALTDQFSGGTEPAAVTVAKYGTPAIALLRSVETIESVGLTVMLVGNVAVCAGVDASDTCNVKVTVPAAVGIPAITPVAALRDRPAGSAPAEMVQFRGKVPPETVGVNKYGSRTVAFGGAVAVTANCELTMILTA